MNAVSQIVIERNSIPVTESGCWLWLRGRDECGYGHTWINGAPARAHRASYEAFVGPIATGLCVCHKCDVPACVNPQHLFLASHRDNILDAVRKGRLGQQKKTQCNRGHDFTVDNTRINGNGARVCITCQRTRSREHMRATRANRPDVYKAWLNAANDARRNRKDGTIGKGSSSRRTYGGDDPKSKG